MSHCDLEKFFEDVAKQMFIVECPAVIVKEIFLTTWVSVVSFCFKKKKTHVVCVCTVYLIFGQIGAAVITFKGGE